MDSETNIGYINPGNANPLYAEELKITEELFTFKEGCSFEELLSDIKQYIERSPFNKENLQNILGIFSIIRPKAKELLTKIKNVFSITHQSMLPHLEEIFGRDLPFIFKLDSEESNIIRIVKDDNLLELQNIVTRNPNIDLSISFQFQNFNINLLDIAIYYGSIQCFKYLLLNRVPFSEYVYPLSYCGGNYEIIHILEDHLKNQYFDVEKCFQMSIAFHQYELTEYLIFKYKSDLTDVDTAIKTFNYKVISMLDMNHKLISLIGTKSSLGRTVLHESCLYGNVTLVRYFCEIHKLSPEEQAKDKSNALLLASQKVG